MDNTRGMLVPDRRRLLLEELERRGSAQVEQLADVLAVSSSTVRRDLALLEGEGALLRAHGGAYLPTAAARPAPNADADLAREAKQRIGRGASDMIVDGMTVMILSGSTTGTMVAHLAGRSVTVVTNGLGIAHALSDYDDITLVVLGGVLHREQMTLLGPMSMQNMADLHVDVMFAGAWGISVDAGVTGAKVIQAGYHHSMLQHTDSLVVLADGTKFGRRGPTLLADADQVNTYVTDLSAPEDAVASLRAGGSVVTLC